LSLKQTLSPLTEKKAAKPKKTAATRSGVSAAGKAPQFIQPMLLLKTTELPEGERWVYEVKLDGYRAIATKSEGTVALRSRNDNDFSERFGSIVDGLQTLPDETVLDGELVALDEQGKPSFNLLQNNRSSGAPVVYYAFDILMLRGRLLMNERLAARREVLEKLVGKLGEPIRLSPELDAPLADLIRSVKVQGMEGLVAKRIDSTYESGQRTGSWQKMRINEGQELVIGGYTPSAKNFDALILGYYEGKKLIYAARTRNGFTPALRETLFKKLQPLEIKTCPFANLPERAGSRWGQGLTEAKMKDCRWLKPVTVGQFEFVEWTPDGHLRHSKFIGLRDDKKTSEVVRDPPTR
ncbi:MAG TPA: non-homologous end-joining DNA ligase, partial [Bryobacteraceae bacterium]|nr:non-homologous end-joining DNA ligase [Bryobacteraceae bacterium]